MQVEDAVLVPMTESVVSFIRCPEMKEQATDHPQRSRLSYLVKCDRADHYIPTNDVQVDWYIRFHGKLPRSSGGR